MRRVPVIFEADAKTGEGMRIEVEGRCVAPEGEFLPFSMATDEGPYHGGARTAPPPLAYFTTGLVSCFLTQMRAFASSLDVRLNEISVQARVEWEAHIEGQTPYKAHGRAIYLDMEIDSSAGIENLRSLVRVAAEACYVEALLAIPVHHRLLRDGVWINLDQASTAVES